MDDLRIENRQNLIVNTKEPLEQNGRNEFGKIIEKTIDRVNGLEKEADISILNLLRGNTEMHETMIALQKADISMRLILSIRNKAIEAYKEIMRMAF